MGVKKKNIGQTNDEHKTAELMSKLESEKTYTRFNFGRVYAFVEMYNDIISYKISNPEKVKLLIDLKETINIELILNETQDKHDYDFTKGKLIKKTASHFNDKKTETRIALNDLKVDIEFYIFETSQLEQTKTVRQKNNKKPYQIGRKTIFTNAQLSLLFNCLIDADIIKDEKQKIAVIISQLTGIPFEQLRKSLSKGFSKTNKSRYSNDDVLKVYEALDKITKNLHSRLNKG